MKPVRAAGSVHQHRDQEFSTQHSRDSPEIGDLSELPTIGLVGDWNRMSMLRRFTFTDIRAGWVDAEIRTSSDVRAVDASYLTDAIRDFADAVASLVFAPTATCRWEQEPGELEWDFNRSGNHLTVAVSFLLRGDRQPLFVCSFQYHSFCRDVLDSLFRLKSALGLAEFEKEWGYPFPAEAALKCEQILMLNRYVRRRKRARFTSGGERPACARMPYRR